MREYELTAFKKGDFQDPNGNWWCSGALKGISEPVRFVVKDPTKFSVGDILYGEIVEATSKAGKPYKRFKRGKKPEENRSFGSNKREWQPRDDAGIRAQWALGKAYERNGKADKTIEEAKWLFGLVEEVKNSVVTGEQKQSEEEFASLLSTSIEEGTEINLDSIPF